jgi:LacI family transcriptional regulator
MRRRLHVALIIETSTVYGRRILRGVNRYLRTHRPWSVFFQQSDLDARPPEWLRDWRGDGILVRLLSPALARRLLRSRVPAVNLNDILPGCGLPRIRTDDRAVGRMAADYLLGRGFRHFAFCGFSGQFWAAERGAGFREALAADGFDCPVYESPWGGPRARPWEREQEAIGRWLRSLPRPAAVLACNDMRGQHVLDSCQRAGLMVPEEVAVLGVDDDELLCELCDPPLSSVVPNPEGVGYEAAALLDRLMAGEQPPDAERLVAPLGVATRQSTDVLAIGDPQVAAAVRYIREHACHGVTVADVLHHVPQARTVLERRFRKFLGRSPQAEIRAVQLKRAKQLLAETELTLEQVAALTGFKHPEYLSVVFKRATGQTPGAFRRAAHFSEGRPRGGGRRDASGMAPSLHNPH